MKSRQVILHSAAIGAVLGIILAVSYGLFIPAAITVSNWHFSSWPGPLSDFGWIPYTIITGAFVCGAIAWYQVRFEPYSRSFRVGFTLLAVMIGAGIGSGPLLAFWIGIVIAAGVAGGILGLIVGSIFGSVLALMAVVTDTSFEDQLLHPLRLRLLASGIAGLSFAALYLAYHVHQGVAPTNGWFIDYSIGPLVSAALAMLPIWLFGPDTKNFYLKW